MPWDTAHWLRCISIDMKRQVKRCPMGDGWETKWIHLMPGHRDSNLIRSLSCPEEGGNLQGPLVVSTPVSTANQHRAGAVHNPPSERGVWRDFLVTGRNPAIVEGI